MRSRLRLVLAALLGAAAVAIAAPPDYPARAVTLVVADAPKSAADIVARTVAAELARAWKKPVVIENRPGADGLLAAQRVARARPDGYTLLYAPNTVFTIEPWSHPVKAFDALHDLEPVAAVGNASFFLAVPRDMTVNTAQELIGNARLRAGAMRYATPGTASAQHFAARGIAHLAGVQWQQSSAMTAAQAANGFSEGTLQFFVDILPVIQPMADAGKAKIIAVTTTRRYPSLPDVASIGEALPEWPGMSLLHGVFAPHATPAAVVMKWNTEVNRALLARPVLKALFTQGFMPEGGTSAQFGARLAREHEDIGRLAKAAGTALP